jgi:hypothetical protein
MARGGMHSEVCVSSLSGCASLQTPSRYGRKTGQRGAAQGWEEGDERDQYLKRWDVAQAPNRTAALSSIGVISDSSSHALETPIKRRSENSPVPLSAIKMSPPPSRSRNTVSESGNRAKTRSSASAFAGGNPFKTRKFIKIRGEAPCWAAFYLGGRPKNGGVWRIGSLYGLLPISAGFKCCRHPYFGRRAPDGCQNQYLGLGPRHLRRLPPPRSNEGAWECFRLIRWEWSSRREPVAGGSQSRHLITGRSTMLR